MGCGRLFLCERFAARSVQYLGVTTKKNPKQKCLGFKLGLWTEGRGRGGLGKPPVSLCTSHKSATSIPLLYLG
jgi:hypothetical protein